MPLKTLIPLLEELVQKQHDYYSIVTIIMDTYKVSQKGAMSRLRQLPKPGLRYTALAYADDREITSNIQLQGM